MITTAILGTKLEQSQTFTSEGERIPVTKIHAGPCWVTGIMDKGGVKKVQLAFGTTTKMNKAQTGYIKKAGLEQKPRFLREVSLVDPAPEVSLGSQVTVTDVLAVGDVIRVTGTSKGKGFAGGVKRHGFKGGPRTHGQSDRERAPGSIGQTTTPGRVYRGKRMAGRMGQDTVTVRGLTVFAIDPENHVLTVKGLVPGARGGLVIVQKEG